MPDAHILISKFLYDYGLEFFIEQSESSNLIMEYLEANESYDFDSLSKYKLYIVKLDMTDFIKKNIESLKHMYDLYAYSDDDIMIFIMIYIESYLLSIAFVYDHIIDDDDLPPFTPMGEVLYYEAAYTGIVRHILSKNPNESTLMPNVVNSVIFKDILDALDKKNDQVSAVGWKIKPMNTTLWLLICRN